MSVLREITAGPLAPVDPSDVRAGAVPQLMWVKIADLVVDDRFQRPLNKANWNAIDRIARAFSWGKFAPVVAAPIEGGRYALIDGQHRAHAAHLCGFDSVPAMVVVLTPEAQAASFAAINGNVTQISAFHVYKAALAAGERWAGECRDAVAAAGCELMTYYASRAAKKPGQVYCVSLVRRMVAAGKAPVVTRGLAALAASDFHGIEAFADRVLDPWFAAIEAVPAATAEGLVAFCRDEDLVDIRDRMGIVSQRPENRGRSARELTASVLAAMLKRRFADQTLPAIASTDESALAARMAAEAAAARKRMRAIT
ncbi:ParB N-terminal domain-containing protein [Defluviimonas sp. WL0002]|uniref:ParB N-terminal domain-containing protein n=1 Tax=Albidovulum marisflavi TaxID=2984159 RepID=A0ABT2ZI05_9RHOB|nr:ParB N-terminal domain-containing protein [Defluviimonas sp. WL0002]MCV2870652.1 ParB N-terminal domain-containing protein [Defluviimonas sp. WL0002]